MSMALVLTVVAAVAAADIPPGCTLHAAFDGSYDAVNGAGEAIVGRGEGAPEFTDGHSGQGLLVGDINGEAGVYFPTEGVFDPERGTIALWVKPENWEGDDKHHHIFFQAWGAERGLFSLYKYQSTAWGLTFFMDPAIHQRGKMYCYQPINDWAPGQWHHIACTWTRYEGMALYIDGKRVKSVKGPRMLDGPMKDEVRFGGDWQSEGGRTVIDEAMVFGRMLSDAEIARLAEAEPPQDVTDIPGVMLTHSYLGQEVLARVYADCMGEPTVQKAEIALIPAAGGEPATARPYDVGPGLNTLVLDLNGVPRGEYTARVSLFAGDTVLGTEALRVSKEHEQTWRTAHSIGVERSVLPPFEPLSMVGNVARCWGRQYQFTGSGLLGSVLSGGQPLLAGPVNVVAEVDGKPLEFVGGSPEAIGRSQTQARLDGGLVSNALDILTNVTVRYDGTVWTQMKVRPRRRTTLSKLSIEIPMPAAQARLYGYNAPNRIDDLRAGYGALDPEEAVPFSREFMPLLWLGTEQRGLGWYAESDEHWDITDRALTVERRGDQVVLCMNVITKPRDVADEFTIGFGLQATPVRPLPADWRAARWVPSTDITRFFLHLTENPYPRVELEGKTPRGRVCYLYSHHEYFTNTLPKDPPEFREMIRRAKGHGLLCAPYTEARLLPEDAGDALTNMDALATMPFTRTGLAEGHSAIAACPQGPFQDWLVWYVSHIVREYGSNGIYLDEMTPMPCDNGAHGCGYVGPDGTRRPTYPVRAALEMYRRIRQVLAETGEPFCAVYHLSSCRLSPMPTYGDHLLIGEELYYDIRDNPDYTQVLEPEQWRAGFLVEPFGVPVSIIPQFKMSGEWMKDPGLAAKFMATVVPHDLLTWPVFADTETIMSCRTALQEFGCDDPGTRVMPYWHTGIGIEWEHPDVLVTGYVRDGGLLLCIANWGEAAAEAMPISVSGALRHAGLRADIALPTAVTWGAGDATYSSGVVTATVPPHSMILVSVTGE